MRHSGNCRALACGAEEVNGGLSLLRLVRKVQRRAQREAAQEPTDVRGIVSVAEEPEQQTDDGIGDHEAQDPLVAIHPHTAPEEHDADHRTEETVDGTRCTHADEIGVPP